MYRALVLDDVGCLRVDRGAGGTGARRALRQLFVRGVGYIEIRRFDDAMSFVARVHRRIDNSGGQQGARGRIGRLLDLEEVLDIAAEIAEMGEGAIVL